MTFETSPPLCPSSRIIHRFRVPKNEILPVVLLTLFSELGGLSSLTIHRFRVPKNDILPVVLPTLFSQLGGPSSLTIHRF